MTIVINNLNDIEMLSQLASDNKCDESLAAAKITSYLVNQQEISFPIEIFFPNPPDILIKKEGKRIFAVEVTQITWERLKSVSKKANPARIDQQGNMTKSDLIVLNPCLFNNIGRINYDKEQRKQDQIDDLNCINKFEGPGWRRGEMEILAINAMETAVKKKQQKFKTYSDKAGTEHVWLFLIVEGLVEAWKNIISDQSFMKQVHNICAQSDFERILLFRDCHDVCELYKRKN